jgi:EmrB/QacA subfamily drug resistance transporter
MDTMDANILNTAIPVISHDFQVNAIDLKIALIGYLMSLAVFIPISGWVADKFSVKPVFIGALILFTISSFSCGFANTLPELVVLRCVQGIGGAFMTLGRLIIARTYQRYELVEAMNIVIMIMSIGVMLGPFIGGVIVDHFSWPWIFWVNVPIGIFLILLAYFALPNDEPKKVRTFDFFGFLLFGCGLALLCFSLSEMSESHVNWQALMWKIIIALALMIHYFFRAKKQKNPLIAIKLFQFRTFRISIIANLCTRLGFGSMAFLLPLFQQIALGFSAQLSGMLMAPMAFGVIASKMVASKILRKVGYRRYLLVNTTIMAILLWLYQFITQYTPIYCIALLTFTFGFFISAQYMGMNSLALAEIPNDELSASTSMVNTNQILAQTLGVAIAAILLRFFSSLNGYVLVLSSTVFHHAFLSLGVITLLSMSIFLLLKPDDGQQMLVKDNAEKQ